MVNLNVRRRLYIVFICSLVLGAFYRFPAYSDSFVAPRTNSTWSIACIVRDESPYLEEWISHHDKLGVTRIYLYDNNQKAQEISKTRDIASKFKGTVIYIPWTHLNNVVEMPWLHFKISRSSFLAPFAARYGYNAQQFAYRDARTRARSDWLQLLDADEFLISSVPMSLYYGSHACGVRIPRYDFGSSGRVKPPKTNVRASYYNRECAPSNYKEAGKVACLTDVANSHRWVYSHACGCSPTVGLGDTVIFHYKTKSLQEYLNRKRHDFTKITDMGSEEIMNMYKNIQSRTGCTKDTRAMQSQLLLL